MALTIPPLVVSPMSPNIRVYPPLKIFLGVDLSYATNSVYFKWKQKKNKKKKKIKKKKKKNKKKKIKKKK